MYRVDIESVSSRYRVGVKNVQDVKKPPIHEAIKKPQENDK
jgi:hypothetical protein